MIHTILCGVGPDNHFPTSGIRTNRYNAPEVIPSIIMPDTRPRIILLYLPHQPSHNSRQSSLNLLIIGLLAPPQYPLKESFPFALSNEQNTEVSSNYSFRVLTCWFIVSPIKPKECSFWRPIKIRLKNAKSPLILDFVGLLMPLSIQKGKPYTGWESACPTSSSHLLLLSRLRGGWDL